MSISGEYIKFELPYLVIHPLGIVPIRICPKTAQGTGIFCVVWYHTKRTSVTLE